MIFVTLEDETGHANIIVWRKVAENQRRALLGSRLMEVTGRIQREGEVLHLVAERLRDRSALLGSLLVPFYATLLMGQSVDLPLGPTLRTILLVVFVPLLAGLATQVVLRRRFGERRFNDDVKPRFPKLASLAVLAIILANLHVLDERLGDGADGEIGEILDGRSRMKISVIVPVTSLCPCSKQISAYGAHNQRSHVTISARIESFMWIEELIEIAEEEASCELYGILKRPDEKYVTERAYQNPKFVEDIVRDIAVRLNADERVRGYVVESENFESIHNHSAYALIEHVKPGN